VLPDADLFAVCDFVPPGRARVPRRAPAADDLRAAPAARALALPRYLPLMPFAIEQLDLTGYDLVVSSSHAVAKGVLTGPDQLHVCMCYSPIRYAWDLQHQYLRAGGARLGAARARRARAAAPAARLGRALGQRRRRLRRELGVRRPAHRGRRTAATPTVIYPPVDTERVHARGARGATTTSPRRAWSRTSAWTMIVEAFRGLPDRRLVVIGDGPQMPLVRAKAGPNVTLLGHQPFGELLRWLRGARAYLFAAVEDFGIAPLEAQACGTPVIAYRGGALPETIPGSTPRAVRRALRRADARGAARGVAAFEAAGPSGSPPTRAARNAERFSGRAVPAGVRRFVAASGRRSTTSGGAARRTDGAEGRRCAVAQPRRPESMGGPRRGRGPAGPRSGQCAPSRSSTAPIVRHRIRRSSANVHERT
jgi:hypothetical protein